MGDPFKVMKSFNLPTNVKMPNIDEMMHQSVEQAMSHMPLPSSLPTSPSPQQAYEVIELMNYIIVKVEIPEEVSVENVTVTLGNCRLVIKGLPQQDPFVVSLPVQPSSKNVSAQYRDRMLEIRLQKKVEDHAQEIFIDY